MKSLLVIELLMLSDLLTFLITDTFSDVYDSLTMYRIRGQILGLWLV